MILIISISFLNNSKFDKLVTATDRFVKVQVGKISLFRSV